MNDLMTTLKRWLKRPGNTQARLAKRLKYESPSTIAKWIQRGAIPRYMHAPLSAALKEG